jgi:hypothetical protein
MSEPQYSRVERVAKIKSLQDPDDSLAYWLSKPIEERFAALEFLRQQWISMQPHAAEQGFQRVCTVTQRARR